MRTKFRNPHQIRTKTEPPSEPKSEPPSEPKLTKKIRVTDPISEIQSCISEIGSVTLFFGNFGLGGGSDFGSDGASDLVRIWFGFGSDVVRI